MPPIGRRTAEVVTRVEEDLERVVDVLGVGDVWVHVSSR